MEISPLLILTARQGGMCEKADMEYEYSAAKMIHFSPDDVQFLALYFTLLSFNTVISRFFTHTYNE